MFNMSNVLKCFIKQFWILTLRCSKLQPQSVPNGLYMLLVMVSDGHAISNSLYCV
jgi:hypothetical protein